LPFCSTSFSRGRTSWCESEASRALGQYDGITSTWRKCRQMPCRAGTAWQIAVPCRQAKAKYCGMPAPAAAIAVPCRQRLKPTARNLGFGGNINHVPPPSPSGRGRTHEAPEGASSHRSCRKEGVQVLHVVLMVRRRGARTRHSALPEIAPCEHPEDATT
jgi:hypothetical protein